MARRFGEYEIERGDNLANPDLWNTILVDLDVRLHALELQKGELGAAIDAFQQLAIARVNDTLTPVLQDALSRLASVGALFEADSATVLTVGTGSKTFTILEAQRGGYVPTTYVAATSVGSSGAMVGEVVSYDRASGLLEVDVLVTIGSGSHADWKIRLSAPPDLDHATRTDNPHLTSADQVGAYTKGEVDTALGAKADASAVATALGAKADTTAVNTALGGKVPTARQVTGAGLASGGGALSEDRAITVPAATQAEAEAGTVTDKAMTPERTKQAILALSNTAPLARDVSFLALMVADLNNNYLRLEEGIADSFDTADGVYVAGASNYVWGVAFQRLAPGISTETLVAYNTGTVISCSASYSNKAFDNITTGSRGASTAALSLTTVGDPPATVTDGTTWFGKQWSAGKTLSKALVYGSSDEGYGNASLYSQGLRAFVTSRFRLELRGKNSAFSNAADGVLLGATEFTGQANESTARTIIAEDISTAYTRHMVRVMVDYAGSGHFQDLDLISVAEIQFYEMTAAATGMSVPSISFTASAQPTKASCTLLAYSPAAFTINTDLIAEVSRDGGTTWTAFTLAALQTLANGYVVYVATGLDISGQPAGTAMKWRLRTANAKAIFVSGIAVRWGT